MNIGAGQTVALVGPSGGGKSTLASLVARFFDVNSGSIKIGGADVREIEKKELADTVSFVFQNSRLIKASILENVKLGRPSATDEEAVCRICCRSSCRAVRRYHRKNAARREYGYRNERRLSFGR